MGIYKQPNKWECGPFALKHALLVHGKLVPEWEIRSLAGSTSDGTDERQLRTAARHFGCDLPTIRKLQPEEARRELLDYLSKGIPCLLCVNEWDHWVTSVREEKGQFIILDSEHPEVIVVMTWPRLRELWVYHESDDEPAKRTETLYDLHPLISKQRVPARARFSLERARFLRQPENRGLAQLWDHYVEDLLAICRTRGQAGGRSLSLGEFLRRHAEMILDQLQSWHGRLERADAERVLQRMQFVADTYGLVIRQSEEKRALAAISINLALWSAGEYGVEPLYRQVPVRKIR